MNPLRLGRGIYVWFILCLFLIQTWRLSRLSEMLLLFEISWAQTNLYWQLPRILLRPLLPTNTYRDPALKTKFVLSLVDRYSCMGTHPCKAKRGSQEKPVNCRTISDVVSHLSHLWSRLRKHAMHFFSRSPGWKHGLCYMSPLRQSCLGRRSWHVVVWWSK